MSAVDGGAPLLVESSVPEIAEAIAPFLADEEGQFWPQTDWWLLHADDQTATGVHLGAGEAP